MNYQYFKSLAVSYGAVDTVHFDQSRWSNGGPIYYWRPFFYARFPSWKGRHRFDGNYCGELSAEWLFLAHNNKLDGFVVQFNKNKIRRRVERSKGSGGSGALRRMQIYFKRKGALQSWRQGTTPPVLANFATAKRRLFWVGFDGPANNTNPVIGHVIAVDNRVTPRVFDPNFGMVEFQNSQQAQGFISTFLAQFYGFLLAGNGQFSGRCDIMRF